MTYKKITTSLKLIPNQTKEDRKPTYVTEILSRNITGVLIFNSIPRFCSMILCVQIFNVLQKFYKSSILFAIAIVVFGIFWELNNVISLESVL